MVGHCPLEAGIGVRVPGRQFLDDRRKMPAASELLHSRQGRERLFDPRLISGRKVPATVVERPAGSNSIKLKVVYISENNKEEKHLVD